MSWSRASRRFRVCVKPKDSQKNKIDSIKHAPTQHNTRDTRPTRGSPSRHTIYLGRPCAETRELPPRAALLYNLRKSWFIICVYLCTRKLRKGAAYCTTRTRLYICERATRGSPSRASEVQVGREGGSRLCEVPRGRAQLAAQLEARVEVRAVEGTALGGHLG